nr:hypothetical protein [Membranihabitans marinus]
MDRQPSLFVGGFGLQAVDTTDLLDILPERGHDGLFDLRGGMIGIGRDDGDGRNIDVRQQGNGDLPDGEYRQQQDGQKGHQHGNRFMDQIFYHGAAELLS